MNETPAGLLTRELGSTKAMANDAMLSDTLVTYLVRRTVEYKMDFAVNCQGDCFVTADGTDLHNAKPLTVLACPPELKHGTKLWIEGYGEAVCHDRGGAIKDKRIVFGLALACKLSITSSQFQSRRTTKSHRDLNLYFFPTIAMSTKVSPEQKVARAFVSELKRLKKSIGFKSIGAFADFIGQNRKTVECWLNGSRRGRFLKRSPRFVLGSTRCTSSSSRSSSPLRAMFTA